jgi:hypothetical protein
MSAAKSRQRRLPRFGIAALPLYKASDLSPKERGHRKTPLRRKNASLAQGVFVDSQRDVAGGRHVENVCHVNHVAASAG